MKDDIGKRTMPVYKSVFILTGELLHVKPSTMTVLPDTTSNSQRLDTWISQRLLVVLVVILIVAVIIGATAVILYAAQFGGQLSKDQDIWGKFGDYLGGTLSPFFAFLSLIALLMTLIIQSKELSMSSRELANSARALKEQSRSLALQNFERTFFELVRLYSDLVAGIDLRGRDGQITAQGKDCVRRFYEWRFKPHYDKTVKRLSGRHPSEIIQEAYELFFDEYQQEIGHCFRTLYRVFKFIDESEVEDKQRYASIMRAQLSSYELALLFYNSLHSVGKNFRLYIEKYTLLENMKITLLFDPPAHVALYDMRAYGDQNVSGYFGKV